MRRSHKLRRIAALAAATALCPAVALAADTMPQLDVGNPLTLANIVWGALVFAGLYFLLSRWALPQVATVLEQRASRIAGDLNAAQAAKAETDRAVAALNETMRTARAEAQVAVNQAVDRAKAEAARQTRETGERVEVGVRAAEARIGDAKTAAMRALRQVTAEATGAMVGRLTGHSPDPQLLDRAVGAALAARGQA